MKILPPVITIDGPGGSGKGTLCHALACKLGWQMLDSGMIYRILALSTLYYNIDIKSEKALVLLSYNLNIDFKLEEKKLVIFLEGKDISNKINSEVIGNKASVIAAFPQVRNALLHLQREFRTEPGLIADGRDMGTVVFPDALVKIFLYATPEERARRKMKQLQKNGFNVKLNDILVSIKERDYRDYNRVTAPLAPANNALILDSTKLKLEEVVELVCNYLKKQIHCI